MERKRGAALVACDPVRTSQKTDPTATRANSMNARAMRGLARVVAATFRPVWFPFSEGARGSSARTCSTCAINLYPRRGSVSMYRGVSAESASTSRMRAIALWRLWSKSTKVSASQSWPLNSSRVTRFPADSSNMASTCKGWPCSRSFTPCLRSSPVRKSNSKASNRSTRAARVGADILTSGELYQSVPQFSFCDGLPYGLRSPCFSQG